MRFIIDSRQHPRDPGGLWKPSLAVFQGPALLAWNNTVFSDADWRNIGKMHQSVKEEDVLKVGRFGLGFQSVHHLTGLSMSLLPSCLARLTVSVANGSPIEVAHAFRRVKFHLLAKN